MRLPTKPSIMIKTSKSLEISQILEHEAINGNVSDDGQLQTIRQLAQRFNTTPVTISKAVDRLARRGIVEKHHGRGIFVKRNRVKSVAVVLEHRSFAEDTGYYFPRFLAEIEAAFRRRRWACHYFIDIDTPFGVQNFDYSLEHGQIEAVVFASQWFFENRLSVVEEHNIPCIGLYRNGDLRCWVTFDYMIWEQMGIEELRRHGCQKIGIIMSQMDEDWNEYGRNLYWQRIRYAEENLGAEMVKKIPFSAQAGWQAMKELWEEQKPDGVLIENEIYCFGVIPAISSLGLSIPDDIMVACYITEGANKMVLPIIELRLAVRDQAEAVADMAVMINAGQKPDNTQIFIRPLMSNPFSNNSVMKQ